MSVSGKPDSEPRYIRPVEMQKRMSLLSRIGWGAEAWAWDLLYWYPLKALSIEQASDAGAALMRFVGPKITPHRTMMRNLRLALPDIPDKERESIARGAWENLGRLAGEMPHLPKMRPYTDDARIVVEGAERLDAVQAREKPAVLIGGHFANWEVMASAICNRPLDCQITYRAANNPYIDRRINRARHAYGIDVLTPKGAGTRELMRALSGGQSVGLMNDQKFNQGIPVPFFGHDAMTAPGPTRLAMRYGVELMPMVAQRTGKARYVVRVEEPFMPVAAETEQQSIHDTVLKINQMVERWILQAPEQWFWMHNRWPKEAWVKAGVM